MSFNIINWKLLCTLIQISLIKVMFFPLSLIQLFFTRCSFENKVAYLLTFWKQSHFNHKLNNYPNLDICFKLFCCFHFRRPPARSWRSTRWCCWPRARLTSDIRSWPRQKQTEISYLDKSAQFFSYFHSQKSWLFVNRPYNVSVLRFFCQSNSAEIKQRFCTFFNLTGNNELLISILKSLHFLCFLICVKFLYLLGLNVKAI